MGKYIIDLEENEIAYKTVNSNGCPMIGLLHPSPYTEPDTEAAYAHGYSNAEIKYRAEVKEAYQKGLSDAWECARKIYLDVDKGGLSANALTIIFGNRSMIQIFKELSASEAIEKIKAYEQKQETDGLRQNIQTIVDQCGYTLDEIASVLEKMRESE